MAIVIIDDTNLTNIANSIREKNGTENTYKPSEMASAISGIQSGGGNVPEKGVVVNEWDSDGYATDITVVGMTSIPICYFYCYNGLFGALTASLTNINFEKPITSIGSSAFDGCSKLALTELPSGITSIGSMAFYGCSNLALTKLPNGITKIQESTFYGCGNLALTELPSGITSIGSSAFKGCSKLALTELPSGITSIGSSAFKGCSKLALTELPSGITYIGSSAFEGCSELALKTLPENISIGYYDSKMFYGCTSLTEMTFPAVSRFVSDSCFAECHNLIKFVMPWSGTEDGRISSNAFLNCKNLRTFVITNENIVALLNNINVFSGTPIASGSGYIYVPETLLNNYKTATNWSTYADQIKPISELEVSE